MASKDEKTKELWVGWTRDALGVYEEPDDVDDVVDDMATFASDYADAMLEEFEHRFADASARKRRSKKGRSRKSALDDDDDDDD
jgi:hypothetical protein